VRHIKFIGIITFRVRYGAQIQGEPASPHTLDMNVMTPLNCQATATPIGTLKTPTYLLNVICYMYMA
jgi:hypothetical protein